MNLIVVDKCTNYCKYCFASNEMAKQDAKAVLQKKDIPIVLDFIRNSGPDFNLNIIGGEPFLYRELPYLVEKVLELDNVRKICIFTGGIASSKVVQNLCHLDISRVNFLFNMNEKKDYKTEKEYELVLKNFDLLVSNGFKANFGYNIYELDFNYQEILDLCLEYGTHNLRWTIAFPELIPNPNTITLLPQEYKLVADKVADFLEVAYQAKIKAALDCPVPKCFFSNEQMGRISYTQPLTSSAIKACGPVIDVTPDLEVFRCYALSNLKRTKLTNFFNYQAAVEFYESNIDQIYQIPETFEYCNKCEFAMNQTCYGGCIAHSPDSIGKRVSEEELLMSMFEGFQKEDIDLVSQIFIENFHVLHDNPNANYLMSFVSEINGNISLAKSQARKSIICSNSVENVHQFKQRFSSLLKQHNNLLV
ncbi:MAG: radical SAM protein [Bacteroidetes bacterium]|nr:radical SAM protein [Bacteroidota bacterium]